MRKLEVLVIDLSVEFAGINLMNPLIVTSATATNGAKAMKKAVEQISVIRAGIENFVHWDLG